MPLTAVLPVWTVKIIIVLRLSVAVKTMLFNTCTARRAVPGTLQALAVWCHPNGFGTACWESRLAGFLHWKVAGFVMAGGLPHHLTSDCHPTVVQGALGSCHKLVPGWGTVVSRTRAAATTCRLSYSLM